jgi:hypothetical protein
MTFRPANIPPPRDFPTPQKKVKSSFLAWWGVIPVIAYVVVQAMYGWTEAKARASSQELAISYFLGGIIGGVLISLVAGWIAYRAFQRSRFGGTITFTLLLGIFCFVVWTGSAAQQSSSNGIAGQPGAIAAVKPSVQPVTTSFPMFGIAVDSPAGWQQLPPDRSEIITRWISPESRAGDVRGIIMVEMKIPDLPDGARIARALAREWGGRVTDDHDSLDGEVAWRIVAEPKTDLQPAEGLAAIHDNRLYLIEGGVTPGHSCHDQIEVIRQSWKWIPLDAPIRHLEFRDQAGTIFNNQAAINYPAAMYVFDDEHPERRFGIGLKNFQLGRDDFTATVEFAQLPAGVTLAKAEEGIGKGIQEKFKLPEAFVWRDLNNGTTRAGVTQVVPGPASLQKDWIMWGIVRLPENHIVLINFTIFDQDPADREIYAKTAQKIVESIVPVTADELPTTMR